MSPNTATVIRRRTDLLPRGEVGSPKRDGLSREHVDYLTWCHDRGFAGDDC
jgi:hypothetical protein